MAELTNPLFENEKEFLERQKLEYERALLGDVAEIKEKTQQVGKYVAVGAGVLGGIWLISKAFGGKKKQKKEHKALSEGPRPYRTVRALRRPHPSDPDLAVRSASDYPHPASAAAQIAPDVYHATRATDDDDPFQPLGYSAEQAPPSPYRAPAAEASSILASTVKSFVQSEAGKMLIAQATTVLLAVVAKKLGDYLPVLKNPDLATSPDPEPETRDIEFTYHHDDAHAPHQPI